MDATLNRALRLIICGGGGHGSEVASYVADRIAAGEYLALVAYLDEGGETRRLGVEHLIRVDDLAGLATRHAEESFGWITAVGDNAARRDLVQRIAALRSANLRPWSCLHPSAQVGGEVDIGEGTCLAPGAVITTRARLGRHCILNVNASISHDADVGDFCNLNPGVTICGNVRMGDGCYIGAGATIIDGVSVGPWTVVGAGAVVVDDLPGGCLALGVPARVVRQLPAQPAR
jgi:sugar O-acyltransferase (sialic acid O-acetyltransferase NeuD family)